MQNLEAEMSGIKYYKLLPSMYLKGLGRPTYVH